jgi:hypothetical protein
MSIFGSRSGSWYINSKTDPRWDDGGYSVSVGGFAMPEEAKKAIEEKKKQLGAPPDDLEWGYMKD